MTAHDWIPYDTRHLVDGFTGMIVLNTADLQDLRVGDVKGFFPPLIACVDCSKLMDESEHNYGTPAQPCCYHCYLNPNETHDTHRHVQEIQNVESR